MDTSELNKLLAEEYLYLQNVVQEFDSKAITIKTWSVTFSLAALGGAYAVNVPLILLLAAISALLFWLLEGYWKLFQYAYYQRTGEIEDHFAGKKALLAPMQIGRVWNKRLKTGGTKRLLRIMFRAHVALPHIIIILLGLLFFILNVANIFILNIG